MIKKLTNSWKQNGGGISRFERVPGVITLLQPEKLSKRSTRQLSTKFVYDSVDNDAVLDAEPYMLPEVVQPLILQGKEKRRRVLYLPLDDAKMLHFISVRTIIVKRMHAAADLVIETGRSKLKPEFYQLLEKSCSITSNKSFGG